MAAPAPAPAPLALPPLPALGGPAADAADAWDPAAARVTLNLRLGGCIVPSEAHREGARVAFSHLAVIDDFITEDARQALLDFLLAPEAGPSAAGAGVGPAAAEADSAAAAGDTKAEAATAAPGPSSSGGASASGLELPQGRWERRTADMAGAPPTWGAAPDVLRALADGQPAAALGQVYRRLRRLYRGYAVALLPSQAIQAQGGVDAEEEGEEGSEGSDAGGGSGNGRPRAKRARRPEAAPASDAAALGAGPHPRSPPAPASVDCAAFVANAAVAGDEFRWHVDADPSSFPSGTPWADAYGDYVNGEPGKPLLVSLILYLNPDWRREWGGETFFLDADTDTGVLVLPRPCRAVLMDQDALHRVGAPGAAAGGRPRISLVFKLVLLPTDAAAREAPCLALPEWGPSAAFGSAARVEAVKRALNKERHRAPGSGRTPHGN